MVISTNKAQHHLHPFYDVVGSLIATDYKDPPVIYEEDRMSYQNVTGTIMAKMSEGYCGQDAYNDMFVTEEKMKVVRRLTPKECERLQGFPDDWTNIGEWIDSKGKKRETADSARYKALGNSIAVPYWKVLARRISAQYDRDITMASLFDGIGGFPLAFEHCGGKAIWASEIEEFPIAVTKIRFPEEESNES